MQIEKVLIVESAVHLFRLIGTKEELYDIVNDEDYFRISLFMDSADIFLNGCKCDEDANYLDMMNKYSTLVESSVKEKIAEVFECDRIEFK
jgi:hypothetical protein